MKKQMNENFSQDKGKELDEKFKELLDELRTMPNTTQEEREKRFEWAKSHPQYDAFVIELMNSWHSQSYNKLAERLEKNKSTTLNQNAGIASTRRGEKDPVVFMESVKLSIEKYTGVNTNGEEYTFLQSVGLNYVQEVPKAAGKNDVDELGFTTGTRKKNLHNVLKLARQVKKLSEIMNYEKSVDEFLEECIANGGSWKFTKKEIELAKRLVEGLDIVASMEFELSEDDEHGTTFGEQKEDKNAQGGFSKIEADSVINSLIECAQSDFKEKWEMILSSTGKRNRELIKAFLSKDILIGLKLNVVGEEDKKQHSDLLEPKCGQWCPRKKCVYTIISGGEEIVLYHEGCFIRYGERPGDCANGDEEVYKILREIGSPFYRNVLKNNYVKQAYQTEIKNLKDLFTEKLKPFNGTDEKSMFQFTDMFLGNALGESKSNISKCRRIFKNQVRPQLYDIFREKLE